MSIATDAGPLAGGLLLPEHPRGVVAFAHGSGSSRHSPRNRHVADVLVREDLATLLVDLLTEAEGRRDEMTGELRFDIPLIGERTGAVVDELERDARRRRDRVARPSARARRGSSWAGPLERAGRRSRHERREADREDLPHGEDRERHEQDALAAPRIRELDLRRLQDDERARRAPEPEDRHRREVAPVRRGERGEGEARAPRTRPDAARVWCR